MLESFTDVMYPQTREVAIAAGSAMKATRHTLMRLEAAGKVTRLAGTISGQP